MTVVNAGSIVAGDGVLLRDGGSVTNQSGGSITREEGIDGLSGAVTVVNAGTITGGNYAVEFAAGYAPHTELRTGSA